MAKLRKKIPIRRGKFVADYRDLNGVRRRVAFDTEAEASAHKLNVRALKPISRSPAVIVESTIKKSIQQYQRIVKERRIGSTAENEKYHFEEIFLFLLNECKIQFVHEVTSFHLECFQAAQLKSGLKASTINRKCNSYRAWLNKCAVWGSIAKDLVPHVERLEEIEPDVKMWSDEDSKEAFKKVPGWLKRVLFYLARSGKRPIDAGRMKWGFIDEARRAAKVYSFKGGKTKTHYYPLTDDLFEMLMLMKNEARKKFQAKDDDFVFLNSKGKPITTNAIGLSLRKAGIRNVTSYGLRHTFVDGLIDDGVHPRDVQVLAGHAKFETTSKYTHRKVEHLKRHSEKRAESVKIQGVV